MKLSSWAIIIAVVVGGVIIALSLQTPMSDSNIHGWKDHEHINATLGTIGTVLDLEVVQSVPAITEGLGHRDGLGSDGMLFLLPSPKIATFWMKDMQFDLDIIWLRNGRVVDITEDVHHPLPGTHDSELLLYSPKTEVDQVLEMNAWDAQKYQISVGDQLEFR